MHISDVEQIHRIYAFYVKNSTATFDLIVPEIGAYTQKMKAVIQNGFAWCCEADGRVLGFCYAHLWKEKDAYAQTLETTLYVHPDWCGQKIGLHLMNRLIADAREHHIHALIACVTSPNPYSERLHQKLGFTQVSHFREVGYKQGVWLDVVDFQLLL